MDTKQQELYNKYPKLFRRLIEDKDEIYCRKGWFPLIDETCKAIQQSIDDDTSSYNQVELVQVKEKFGGLRMYYEGGNEATRKMVNTLINNAEDTAEKTCEVCGATENMGRVTKDWIQNLCKECGGKIDGWNPQ